MNRNWRKLKTAIACWLIFSLSIAAAPSIVQAQAKPDGSVAAEPALEKSTKHHNRKGAYVLTLVGAGTIGLGAFLMTWRPTYNSSFVYSSNGMEGLPGVQPIDFGRNSRKISGGLIIGFGSLLTVGGLLKMRQPKTTSEIQDRSKSASRLFMVPERLSTRHERALGDLPGIPPTFSVGHLGRATANDKMTMFQASGFSPRILQMNGTTVSPVRAGQTPCFAAPAFTMFAKCSQ
ncbi:MAG: hypothetical protein LAO04_18935 [Acidobacteriia bacterium]|nr:hypothetical protein [Terriglobia bacterium]